MKSFLCRRQMLIALFSAVLLVPSLHAKPLASQAAPDRGAIAGKVTDSQGRALPGVAVALSGVEHHPSTDSVVTAADGSYQFVLLAFGKYRLSFKKSGYMESASGPIELGSQTVEANFTLQPLLLASPDPGGFVSDDRSASDQSSFVASGVAGATAPSGYSAGASVDDSALAVARMARLQGSDLSLLHDETMQDCTRENDLLASARMRPESFRSNHDLGVFYVEHSEVSKGLTYLRLASMADPLNATNARWLALAYTRTNQVPKAIALIHDLAGKLPADADLALLLARLYLLAGDRLHAIAYYLLTANLDAGEGYSFACGIGLLSTGSVEKATSLFSQAIGRHPDSSRLWMGLGVAQDLADEKSNALRSLSRAADEDPDYLPTYLFLAALSGADKESDTQILRRLEVLVAAHPESAEAHYDYALALWKHQRLDRAARLHLQTVEHLKLAIAEDPEFAPAHLKLGIIYQDDGDQTEAAKELKSAVQLDPGNATAHYRLAQVYRRMKQATLADLELAQFEGLRHAPLQEDDTTQGLLLYAPELSGPISLGPSCHPAP